MSDHQEIVATEQAKRKLIIWLSIPNETWTDAFCMLSRRILLQTVQPSCHRFTAIGDKNVKSVHIVENPEEFVKKLAKNDPVAKEQLKHMANSNCLLAGQIRFKGFSTRIPGRKEPTIFGVHEFPDVILPPEFFMAVDESNNANLAKKNAQFRLRYGQAQKAVMRHSMDLLRGCDFRVFLVPRSTEPFAYLTLLEASQPVHVFITTFFLNVTDLLPRPKISYYLGHPTVMKCNKLTINGPIDSRSIWRAIFEWLHYRPICDNCAIVEEPEQRCLLLIHPRNDNDAQIELLLKQSLQNLQQSQGLLDRRQFVLAFKYGGLLDLMAQFGRTQNVSTGEVLTLEQLEYVPPDNGMPADMVFNSAFRLRRCLLTEFEDDGTRQKEFNAKMFKHMDLIDITDEKTGKEPIKVEIH